MSTLKVDTITDSSSGLTTTINGFTPNIGNMRGRNIVINGNMLIAQRGTGASTANNGFAVDRWKNISNTTDFSAQQSSVVPSGQEFTKSLHITPTATKAHSGSDYFFTSHYVEGYNIGGLGYGTSGAKTITISFWVRSSKTGTYSLGMKNSVANRSRQNEYTISVADTWEKKTIVVPGETTGSWPVDNTRGIAFDFCLAGQAAATSSVNTWLPNNSNMSSNQVNFFDNTNNNFYLTGVQVEVGSEATEFDNRSHGEELSLCERYFETSYLTGITPGSAPQGNGAVYANTHTTSSYPSAGEVRWRTKKRATPAVVIYNSQTGTTNSVYGHDNGVNTAITAVNSISENGFGVFYASGGGFTAGYRFTYHYTADSEL